MQCLQQYVPKLLKIKEDASGKTDLKDALSKRNDNSKRILDHVKNIARALCTTPKVLIADEIVSGLDVSIQAQILNLMMEMRERTRISMLFISHDLSVVRYLCNRVAIMNSGRIVEEGPTDRVFANPQHDYTRALLAAVP